VIKDTKTIDDLILRVEFELARKESHRNKDNVSLMGGECGIVLFYTHLYKYTGDEKYLTKALDLLESSFETLNRVGSYPLTFARGFSGIGWAIEYLHRLDLLEENSTTIFGTLDALIAERMYSQMKGGVYDYLHGALGCALFFLSRNDDRSTGYLTNLVQIMNETKLAKGDCFFWHDYDFFLHQIKKNTVNLGLSHGLPSIILILLKIQSRGIQSETCRELIEGCVKFLLSCENKDTNRISAFGHTTELPSLEQKSVSRLSWCYGDLGIIIALIKVNQNFPHLKLENSLKQWISLNSVRKNTIESAVDDVQLCHGAIGISLMFSKILRTADFIDSEQRQMLQDASFFWLQEFTLMSNNAKYGLLKFDVWKKEYVEDFGLLEGLAGIGLCLMDLTSPKLDSWDECLLLR